MLILDYSNYRRIEGYYGEPFPEVEKRDLLDNEISICPYCHTKLNLIYNFTRSDENIFTKDLVYQNERIYFCEKDGWWQHKIYESQDVPKTWYCVFNESILKKYNEDSLDLPISILKEYINKNPEKITLIHDKKMEELVASVFKSFYLCDVKLIGKSNDGGVDIILLDADNPIMVQVKRRKNINTTESVSYIRELIGATLLKDSKSSIFVTTAEKFSNASQNTASLAINKGLVNSFELINYSRFIEMLRVTYKNDYIEDIKNIWNKIKVLENLK